MLTFYACLALLVLDRLAAVSRSDWLEGKQGLWVRLSGASAPSQTQTDNPIKTCAWVEKKKRKKKEIWERVYSE